jgi:hypothetical protein
VLKERAIYDAFQDEETGCPPSSSSEVLLSTSTSTSMVPMQTQTQTQPMIRCNDPPADSDELLFGDDALVSEGCVINNGMDPSGDGSVDDLMALSGSHLSDDAIEDEGPISGPTEERDGLHINANDDYKDDDDDIDDAADASDSTKRISCSSDRRRTSISPCSSRDDDDDEHDDAAISLSFRVLKERMKQTRFSLEGRYKEMLVMPLIVDDALPYSTLFYSILLYSILLYPTLLCPTLFYSTLFYSTLFYSILLLATKESASAVDRSARVCSVTAAAHDGRDPLSPSS